METKKKNIIRKIVKVLDICLDFSEIPPSNVKNSIVGLGKGWNSILAEIEKIDNEYFGIIVSSNEAKLGIV